MNSSEPKYTELSDLAVHGAGNNSPARDHLGLREVCVPEDDELAPIVAY